MKLKAITVEEFRRIYGYLDTSGALSGFTPPRDTTIVLTLLAHSQPQRILEIGTAFGHMTANLTEWSSSDAIIFFGRDRRRSPMRNRRAAALRNPQPGSLRSLRQSFRKNG